MLFVKKKKGILSNDGQNVIVNKQGGGDGQLGNENEDSKNTTGNTSPSIVQFYNERFIDFQNGITTTTTSSSSSTTNSKNKQQQQHPYSCLSYHSTTVRTDDDDDMDDDDGNDQTTMGIWNIRYDSSNTTFTNNKNNSIKKKKIELLKGILSETVLLRVDVSDKQEKSAAEGKKDNNDNVPASLTSTTTTASTKRVLQQIPYVISLDLNVPSSVAPFIQSVIQAIIETNSNTETTMDDSRQSTSTSSSTSTIEKLKTFTFGDAPGSVSNESSEGDNIESGATSLVSKQKISIVFVCLLPTTEPSTFKQKQAQALVMYHLHRYAYLVNGCLIFCKSTSKPMTDYNNSNDNENEERTMETSTSSSIMNGMSVENVRDVMYQLSLFHLPKEKSNSSSTSDAAATTTNGTSSTENGTKDIIKTIYLPKDHNKDMIEGMLRRNASCEGSWDVDKDSLLKALPPTMNAEGILSSNNDDPMETEYDDQIWMKQLADTIRVTSTSGATTNSSKATSSGSSSSTSANQKGGTNSKEGGAGGKVKKDNKQKGTETNNNKGNNDTKAKDFF